MPVPFKLPRFYPILDTALLAAHKCSILSAAEGLFDAGVRILQYRHKDEWTQAHFDEAKKIAERCQDLGVLFVLNDRADYARLLRSALHIGQEDLPPAAARGIISDEILGLSTHNEDQLIRADREPVEYLSIGPIFSTRSKRNPDPEVGLQELSRLRQRTAKPLVAIGGIKLENARDVLAAKADSLAVISGFISEGASRKTIRRTAEQWIEWLA
ncbi:MAG TPA: thiamine phosphate synthase [Bryobacteraceae bacterium]|jgi:thiamine-phosphate pyrophosphorylase|nr:thiamine phosphate synthase [Bryobacteraceae bacterium]